MIRQQAFSGKEKMLKGGLHCHTTRSDGKLTPEEAIALHKENGYDFLAITDHRIYNFKNFLPESGITIIPGMEFDNGTNMSFEYGLRCFHTVCLGPSKEDGNGFEQDESLPQAVAKNQEEYQPYLDDIHAKNNLTIYCHPEWSNTPAKYFEKQKGNIAMEIWNSGCAIDLDMDRDAAYWDELLAQNIRLYGVATDDGHPRHQHCKGWVMVRAENNINSILKALEDGKFYSSCGPEIYDFYADDEKIVVECSPSHTVRLISDGHVNCIRRSEEGNLTRAVFELPHWGGEYLYVRATVIDNNGKYAWTNPIFMH